VTLADVLAHPGLRGLADALGRRAPRVAVDAGITRRAAVALVLRPSAAGQPELLMI
jgi:hypothetical protein